MTTPRRPERIVFVTDQRAAQIARNVFRGVKGAAKTSAARIADRQNRRRSSATVNQIQTQLQRSKPDVDRRGGDIGVWLGNDGSTTRCPPVVIALDARADVAPEVLRWAERSVQRWGADRVKLRFNQLPGQGT